MKQKHAPELTFRRPQLMNQTFESKNEFLKEHARLLLGNLDMVLDYFLQQQTSTKLYNYLAHVNRNPSCSYCL